MKKLLIALVLLLSPASAWAQCTGIFAPNTYCGNNSASPAPPAQISGSTSIIGPGSSTVGDLALWNNLTGTSLKDSPPAAFTRTNDTNVTATLGGSPNTALVNAMSITFGWSGTLAAGRLNANVVQAFTNDTNVTATISAQNATLGWTGTLSAARGGTGADNHTDTGFATWSGGVLGSVGASATVLPIANGGTNGATQQAAFDGLAPTATRAGDISYWNGTHYVNLAGNNSGTQLLQETSAGVPSWVTVSGTGTVTSVICGTGLTGGTITTSGTCAISPPIAPALGGTGNISPTANTIPINEGATAQNNTGVGTLGQAIVSSGTGVDPAYKSGVWVLLNTLTASNSTTLQDTTSLTASFNEYMIVFESVVPASNNVSCEIQVHTSGGFQTSSYLGLLNEFSTSGPGSVGTTTFMPCSLLTSLSSSANFGVSGTFTIYNPSTSGVHQWTGLFSHLDGAIAVGGQIAGFYNSSTAVDGIRVLMSTGNIATGTVKIYGML